MANRRDGFALVAAGDGDIRSSAIVLVIGYDDGSVVRRYKFKIEKRRIGSVLDGWVAALNR